ncbi:glycerol-3-phosphate dehydrogenase/oxidase [Parageobacillus thermoglucosidasius]|uniref:glycerol-3-phosphate dehydrogenase/oxidase n=1 Tax=Parageobacillus thermoglucosidasius TaxID=1426 RepID=UPI000E19FB9B|nr:FAD-dependent oxidoreductase [Parageobacillus thermoglucosidasius]MED4905957.1 FAD-dependent oxidoreductase [Parageobacillus thermoglucosidasius]MED4914570.1 FAD-dependent oxidoreductase [Parageobacillus thermoglucosidasius]MED4946997.1 FAD-dependent oxidoreductase [Parageobacillus thermoglucosidasius]MED4983151.1 FAD-dependent oxidoreductase [Parageobacillus thermoglucosidasius]RDE23801.1 glycerol-3-phosphate dehydrogenase/oxidase [Parageobacillus thermoglucosidasius]
MTSTLFSSKQRRQRLEEMSKEHYDILVVGGGITGCGIALDAVSRGMKTALVEMQDFAAGTSSRSTKLVHGGLRYLKQFEVKMVAEVGRERAIVYENGPHVTTPEWMLLPIHKGGTFGKWSTSIGLWIYDHLAGVKKSERRTMLNAQQTLQKEPLIKQEGLRGGGYYVEYRTDDARLTIEVIKKAVELGANAVNYAKVEQFLYDENSKVIGARCRDQISGQTYEIRAKKVINAAGPWVDTLREKDRSKTGKRLQLTKGVHIVIDQKRFPLKQAIYFDTPDGRMVFAIPRDGKTYVGTTDTFYNKDIANPKMTKEDRDYLLRAIRYMFPSVNITADDIESSWAGVRPLIYEEGKDPSEISRKDEIWQSPTGLITIAGGKLTGYRKMAETVVDLVAKLLEKEEGKTFLPCQTKHLPISGGDVGGSQQLPAFIEKKAEEAARFGFTKEEGERLAKIYGTNVDQLFELSKQYDHSCGLSREQFVRLVYAIDYEMAAKPIDYFIRRTGALLFDIASVRHQKDRVIAFMADYLQWTEEQTAAYTEELEKALREATTAAEKDGV